MREPVWALVGYELVMDKLLTPSEIAGYAEGLRRLALSLVRDAAAADDAVQDTLVRALRSPPRHGATTKAWFHTVLRNTVRRGWRSESRRRRREEAQSRVGSAEAPLVRLERTEMADAVIAALRTLPDAQREVLELRYFEARKPAAIAADLGVPVETVKTRIKRGRAAMRAELDREHRGTWVAGFVGAFGLDASAVFGATTAGMAIVVLVAMLLAGVGLWIALGPNDDAAHTEAEASKEPVATDTATISEGPLLRGSGARASTSEETSVAKPPEGSSDKEQEPELRDAPGRIVVTDAHGRPVRVPQATLHVTMTGRGVPHEREVSVRNGHFVMELATKQYPNFVFLSWDDGVGVVTKPQQSVRDPFAEEMVVHVRAVEHVLIHVLDASTGQALPSICFQRTGSGRKHLCHPGPGTEHEVTWGNGPIRVRATMDDMRGQGGPILVGAPGYGWESVDWNPRTGEPVRVELKPAGRLHLHTPGPKLTQAAHVRVRGTDRPGVGYRAFWLLQPDGHYILDDLPAGSYVARVEIGRWFDNPEVLASQAFTITAGAAPELTLAYEAPKHTRVVPVRGAFHLPTGWSHEGLSVCLTRLGASSASKEHTSRSLAPGRGLTRDQVEHERYRMDAGKLAPGRYQVEVDSVGYIGEFVVPADGGDDLRLRVPPPVEVQVDVEGDVGGRVPFVRSLSWNCVPPKGFRMYSSKSAERSNRDEPFVFKAPAGRILIHPTGYAFRVETKEFEIYGDEQRIVLRVHPDCIIHIIARHEGKTVRWEWGWKVEVEGVGHERKLGARSFLADRRGFWVSVGKPGQFRVRVGPIPGYEALPARIIDVGERAPAEVVYELTPRR